MTTALILVSDGSTLPAALGPYLAAAVDLAKAEKAASTRKAYGTDFRLFREWCEAKGVSALPAASETVAAYLAAQAGASKASTLGRRVAQAGVPCRPMRRASRPPCAAFAEPMAAPGSAKPRRSPAKCLAWSPRRRTSWRA